MRLFFPPFKFIPSAYPYFYLLSPQCFVGGVKRAAPGAVQGAAPGLLPNKNLYEHHYAALEQLANPQAKVISSEGSAGPGIPIRSGSGVLGLLDC